VRFFPLSPEASALPKADRISDHESNESSCNRPFVVGRIMGNAQPGLVVDSEITSAYSHDFYLQSHGATAGTARPTHYRVAFDQNKLSADDIQHLTWNLCFGSQIATQSLSQPAPTYYASKLARRARLWLQDYFKGDLNDFNGKELKWPPLPYSDRLAMRCHMITFMRLHGQDAVEKACMSRLTAGSSKMSKVQPWGHDLKGCMFWL